jgi:ornithine--oxo-acid transaminase
MNPELTSADYIALDERYGAHNYHPLPVVIASGDGAWVTDVEGARYLDFLSAYSALNFGHQNPDILAAATGQLGTLTLTSRAVHNDQLGMFLHDLSELCGMEMALPMNSGAEGVETALKTARRWGYETKGVEPGRAKILVVEGNFHGRTTTIISFSGDEGARDGFGPFTPGFVAVPFGDIAALEAAIDDDTVAFLFEPVQGEAGVILPPEGYLRAVREVCTQRDVLMIADEIQSGFGRTGATFACDQAGVKPDVYILGKALGGGIMPLSAVVSSMAVLGVLTAGSHGSTFGGNPLATAIGRAVIKIVNTGVYQERSARLGAHMLERLLTEAPAAVREVRGIGLWAGIELKESAGTARARCERLLAEGVICKDTHTYTMRLAPPLCIELADLDTAIDKVIAVLAEVS